MTPHSIAQDVFRPVTIEEIAAPRPGAIKIGPFGSQLKKDQLSAAGFKVYGQENIIKCDFAIGERWIDPAKFKALEAFQLFPGDLVISMMGTIGKCAIFPSNAETGIMDSHVLRIQLNSEIADVAFVSMALGEPDILGRQLARMSHGSIMSGLSSAIVKSLRVPLPSLPEQRRISEIVSTMDTAIDETGQLIAKLREIKTGLMHDLLTRGLDENGELRDPVMHPEQFRDSGASRIPKDWAIYRTVEILERLIDFRGKTPKKLGLNWGDGDIPALCANNVEMGRINLKKETYYGCDELYRKWMNKGAVEMGDIVMTMEAPLGNVAQIPDGRRYILSQRVVLLKTKRDLVNNDFLKHLLMGNSYQSRLREQATGTTATGIQQAKLIQVIVPIPSMQEQARIAAIIAAHDARICAEEAHFSKLKQLKQGLMADLLTGKVRVTA